MNAREPYVQHYRGGWFAAALKACWLLTLASVLAGCEPAAKLPLTGEVGLKFLHKMQSNLYFELTNQSHQAMIFRGSYDRDEGANPWDTLMECRAADADPWTEGPFALVDGSLQEVEVSPGEQLQLIVGSDEFTDEFRGGRCRLGLMLKDRTSIKSSEFEP